MKKTFSHSVDKQIEWFVNLRFHLRPSCQLHCTVCQQSCQLASEWLLSPSCIHIQTQLFLGQGGCWTRRHSAEQAVGNFSGHIIETKCQYHEWTHLREGVTLFVMVEAVFIHSITTRGHRLPFVAQTLSRMFFFQMRFWKNILEH